MLAKANRKQNTVNGYSAERTMTTEAIRTYSAAFGWRRATAEPFTASAGVFLQQKKIRTELK